MKSIELKEGKITFYTQEGIQEQPITTLGLISQVLDSPPEGGFKFTDFKVRKRIDDAISQNKKGATKLSLEDEDYISLKDCVMKMSWTNRSKFIQEFIFQFVD